MEADPVQDRFATRPWWQRVSGYLPMFLLVGIAGPALIYVTTMSMLGWRTSVFGPNAAVTSSSAERRVYLYVSKTTTEHFVRTGGNYEVLLNPWRAFFTAARSRYNFTELRDLAPLRERPGGVLVLPSAVALTERERADILSFRAAGGAVLATWATGTRNDQGAWEGWQFLERLGARAVGEMPSTSEDRHLVLVGESPVSHSQPAGMRIWMSKTAEPLLRLKGERIGGLFTDWSRVLEDERRGEGAIIFEDGTSPGGRSAVFGFAETTWESHPMALYPVIDDTLQFLRREPVIVRAAWPDGKRAAYVLEMDTEDGFPNATRFAEMLRTRGLRGTFYILTSVGVKFPDVVTQLSANFEIGYHGDVHDSFKGQPAVEQERRLRTMRAELSPLLRNPNAALGFRAPLEGYDATTELLLQRNGFRHHAADPQRSEARLPLVPKMEDVAMEDALIVLPRTQRDDINLARQKLNVEQTTKALIDDFNIAVETGALGWLSVHTQNFEADSTLALAMPAALDHFASRAGQAWIASAGQVADWWRNRDRLKLASTYTGKRLDFDVTVVGKAPLAGPSFVVMLPQRNAIANVRGAKVGTQLPKVVRLDDLRVALVFEQMAPGNYSYQITFSSK
jgi:peptidoglycan/xylan/chitin deacetylase (PgdA/CDA1 family)